MVGLHDLKVSLAMLGQRARSTLEKFTANILDEYFVLGEDNVYVPKMVQIRHGEDIIEAPLITLVRPRPMPVVRLKQELETDVILGEDIDDETLSKEIGGVNIQTRLQSGVGENTTHIKMEIEYETEEMPEGMALVYEKLNNAVTTYNEEKFKEWQQATTAPKKETEV